MVERAAQYTLILESLAEINARLRVLDEAYARLEAAAERQLELLGRLTPHHQLPLTSCKPAVRHAMSQNGSVSERGSQTARTQADRFFDRDTEYSRTTHPALFRVIDLLEQNEQTGGLSVRQLAQQTGVSKSWCAIAKRHVLSKESVQ